MQFYLNGYRPGDPFRADPHPSVKDRPEALPEEVDVLVVGGGPALSVQVNDTSRRWLHRLATVTDGSI